MSVRVEWFDANFSSLTVEPEGSEIGEHSVTAPLAVVLAADSVAVLEGTPERLREMLSGALAEIARSLADA